MALDALTGDRLTSFRVFIALTTAAANLLLFHVARRRRGLNLDGVVAVVGFGLARVLLTFRLEWPWDGLDILLFLAFGAWASRGGSLLGFGLLLLAGTLNHETVLYIPLWYLLAPLDTPRSSPRLARQVLIAAALMIVMGGVIVSVRDHLYRGQPNLPGQVFEPITPVIGNPIHLAHNLRMLVWEDWKAIMRAFISASLLAVLGLLVFNLTRGRSVRASAWSLCVIGSVFVFGYINETRLYFPLIAFWFAYADHAGARPRERDERA